MLGSDIFALCMLVVPSFMELALFTKFNSLGPGRIMICVCVYTFIRTLVYLKKILLMLMHSKMALEENSTIFTLICHVVY